MNTKEIKYLQSCSEFGVIKDELNPIFIFSNVKTELLEKIEKGEIDVMSLVRYELENRGK